MKKIGILGGTFNPIHHGHLILGQAAKEEFGLDEILVMPTKNPAYKTISGGVSEQNRVDMIKLAISRFPYFRFSDMELKREGTTYTVDTLRALTQDHKDCKYYFIMGADSLLEIERWKHPDRLMTECTLLVAVRDDCDREGLEKQIIYLTDKYQADIKILPANRIDISSTKIRRMIREGKSVRYMLPDQVIRFIQKNHLYRQETSSEK